MSDKPRWNTIVIEVPSEMIVEDKRGKLKIKHPLTKSSNVASVNKQKSIVLKEGDIAEPKIVNKGYVVPKNKLTNIKNIAQNKKKGMTSKDEVDKRLLTNIKSIAEKKSITQKKKNEKLKRYLEDWQEEKDFMDDIKPLYVSGEIQSNNDENDMFKRLEKHKKRLPAYLQNELKEYIDFFEKNRIMYRRR